MLEAQNILGNGSWRMTMSEVTRGSWRTGRGCNSMSIYCIENFVHLGLGGTWNMSCWGMDPSHGRYMQKGYATRKA